jgi:hypothetical protein
VAVLYNAADVCDTLRHERQHRLLGESEPVGGREIQLFA